MITFGALEHYSRGQCARVAPCQSGSCPLHTAMRLNVSEEKHNKNIIVGDSTSHTKQLSTASIPTVQSNDDDPVSGIVSWRWSQIEETVNNEENASILRGWLQRWITQLTLSRTRIKTNAECPLSMSERWQLPVEERVNAMRVRHSLLKLRVAQDPLNGDLYFRPLCRDRTYPTSSLKHFEVQWVSRQPALYFGERMARSHASNKLGLH